MRKVRKRKKKEKRKKRENSTEWTNIFEISPSQKSFGKEDENCVIKIRFYQKQEIALI